MEKDNTSDEYHEPSDIVFTNSDAFEYKRYNLSQRFIIPVHNRLDRNHFKPSIPKSSHSEQIQKQSIIRSEVNPSDHQLIRVRTDLVNITSGHKGHLSMCLTSLTENSKEDILLEKSPQKIKRFVKKRTKSSSGKIEYICNSKSASKANPERNQDKLQNLLNKSALKEQVKEQISSPSKNVDDFNLKTKDTKLKIITCTISDSFNTETQLDISCSSYACENTEPSSIISKENIPSTSANASTSYQGKLRNSLCRAIFPLCEITETSSISSSGSEFSFSYESNLSDSAPGPPKEIKVGVALHKMLMKKRYQYVGKVLKQDNSHTLSSGNTSAKDTNSSGSLINSKESITYLDNFDAPGPSYHPTKSFKTKFLKSSKKCQEKLSNSNIYFSSDENRGNYNYIPKTRPKLPLTPDIRYDEVDLNEFFTSTYTAPYRSMVSLAAELLSSASTDEGLPLSPRAQSTSILEKPSTSSRIQNLERPPLFVHSRPSPKSYLSEDNALKNQDQETSNKTSCLHLDVKPLSVPYESVTSSEEL